MLTFYCASHCIHTIISKAIWNLILWERDIWQIVFCPAFLIRILNVDLWFVNHFFDFFICCHKITKCAEFYHKSISNGMYRRFCANISKWLFCCSLCGSIRRRKENLQKSDLFLFLRPMPPDTPSLYQIDGHLYSDSSANLFAAPPPYPPRPGWESERDTSWFFCSFRTYYRRNKAVPGSHRMFQGCKKNNVRIRTIISIAIWNLVILKAMPILVGIVS